MAELDKTVKEYLEAFGAGIDYCKPYWETFARLYQLWKMEKFDELLATYSKVNLGVGYAAVQDRIPKIFEGVFSNPGYISLRADDPEFEDSVDGSTAWLRDMLDDKIKIQKTIMPTLQTMTIGGTAYRAPCVKYVRRGKSWEPRIGSENVDFFNIIPAPGGGVVNPWDVDSENAVPWVMRIAWVSEDYITAQVEKGIWNKEAADLMLRKNPNYNNYPEQRYQNTFASIDSLHYAAPGSWKPKKYKSTTKRRVVHWFKRDKHIIIGEDAYKLYEGPPVLPGGIIPIVKYILCPDISNWFGIPYLGTIEDLLKTVIMNLNYRLDHLLGVMFPVTWIRSDIAAYGKYREDDFIPRPYDVKFFPSSIKDDIRKTIYYDRRPEITPQAFIEEDRLKSLQQKIGGQTETTNSLQNVVGNRTATGVTSILAELSGRVNMESMVVEHYGLREECLMLLAMGDKFIKTEQVIRRPSGKGGFPWTTISPEDITNRYTVLTHGSKYMADKSQSFQKLLALLPYMIQSQSIDQYELWSEALKVADVLPDADKVLVPPQPAMTESMAPAAGMNEPGGAASALDINQKTRSTENRQTVEPGTGREIPAGTAY